MDKVTRSRLHALRGEGHTIREIARMLGVSFAAVGFVVRAADETRDWEDFDAILRDRFVEGITLRHIATELGTHMGVVSERVRVLGLTRGDIRDRGIEYRRAKSRERERKAKERGAHVHGLSGYKYGCRCQICTTAHYDYFVVRQNRTREGAKSHFQRWTDSDDNIAIDTTLTIEEAALRLGRTYGSVAARRSKLQRELALVSNPREQSSYPTGTQRPRQVPS